VHVAPENTSKGISVSRANDRKMWVKVEKICLEVWVIDFSPPNRMAHSPKTYNSVYLTRYLRIDGTTAPLSTHQRIGLSPCQCLICPVSAALIGT
jgi:hypothetical protein